MNFFASLKEALTEGVISQIAVQKHEKPEKIQKIFDALGVSLVGGLIKRVTTESGMKLVFNQARKIDFEPDQIADILKNELEFERLRAVGEKDLNTVLPGLKSAISSMVAKYAGTQNSLVSSLCGVAMPIVMSVLKHKIAEKKFDAESLAAYLGDQREGLLTILPDLNDKLIETIGIQYLLQNFSVPRTEESGVVSKGAGIDNGQASQPFLVGVDMQQQADYQPYLKWAGLGALVVGAIATGIYFWNQRDVTSNLGDTETDSTMVEARTIQEPAAGYDSLPKDTATAVSPPPAPTLSATNPMAMYLENAAAPQGKVFKFENVDFEDNTTQLKAAANAPVTALAELLRKYPNAQVKLVGYANDAKLPVTNKVLSVKRVFALKDALIKSGISYIRIDAEGRGSGVSSKDSSRIKKPLREIYVRFVKK
ncbi:DUF937 domain-containing protein [Runella slithyformis]|uniref:OmpA-like domain-containing protein n=1 Tax=Runella slithyformis (strain ATCC 29530 / DSM 19594 / LMG 11500 / NCIMB 11436 / LSU 4) TaxID=761193 RepID=A0A7U3ZFY8_RUNSL|nr:DUF937 domain-containing protein [Runella slithyformis]AEI46508.1 hypothetical protein Runsl_0049 [Runella slithyformis DSM 19594]